jgi:ammonium transporter, Amt family
MLLKRPPLSALRRLAVAAPMAWLAFSTSSFAQDAVPTIDKADTTWVMISSALVLMMLIPGLALFYCGLVRKENVLASSMQSFATCCLVSLLWVICGYTLVFTEGSAFIGGTSQLFLKNLGLGSISGTIPESVFIMFQLTFAAITAAIVLGAVADRIKFSATLLFMGAWMLLVYLPVAHWVWGPKGFLGGVGAEDFKGFLNLGPILDYAGGMVVHVNAGVAGLVAAIVLGKRLNPEAHSPNNLLLSLVGASLLWVGWFGFNAGSALAAGDRAGMAMLVTHLASASAAVAWMMVDWIIKGKPSVLGTISGAVAGLVAITPASGFVNTQGAICIGMVAGLICPWACYSLKERFKYDDSLDVFGVHGIGGIIGSILTGVFATKDIGGVSGALEGNATLLLAQIAGTLLVLVYSGAVTWLILKLTNAIVGLRVDDHMEHEGIDLHLHGEAMQ